MDNTNPRREDRAPIIVMARGHGAEVVGFSLESDLKSCLERNAGRTGRERVPDKALSITSRRMQEPTLREGFDRLYRVRLAPDGQFEVVEIDGTRG